ncbi:MAG: chemotaxis protein CheW [Deferrisomatales bacterium]
MAHSPSGILTEVGTNELEVVEFAVDDRPYVINVAKVREILGLPTVMPVPGSHPCMLGVFRSRDEVIPLLDLGRWLDATQPPDPRRAKIIVAEFNRAKVGFLVHGVSRIHRLSWTGLEAPKPGSIVESRSALGFVRLGRGTAEGERIAFLLDFERIVGSIRPPGADGEEPDDGICRAERRRGKTVLVAEDSSVIRKVLENYLAKAGFTVEITANGQEAWRCLEAGRRVDAVVSDIEMPVMDGHHLTRRIKSDPRFRGLPVVLYSSMIYEEMRRKGEAVGADAQICKPELKQLPETLDGLIFGHPGPAVAAAGA